MLRWRQTLEFADLVDYYKGLISLRKKLPGLCDKSPDAFRRIYAQAIHGPGVVSFRVDNRPEAADDGRNCERIDCNRVSEGSIPGKNGGLVRPGECMWEELFVVYNASAEEWRLEFQDGELFAESSSGAVWEILADGRETDCRRPLPEAAESVSVGPRSGLLLGKRVI
ncbi:MAG: hypothetical protein NC306_16065, partial [Butyrivibrio sp.]|nr:hypothetical protein [Butyrivibrio sp.]